MDNKFVRFLEGSLIKEKVDSFSGRELLGLVLPFYPFLSSPQIGKLAFLF